jgi:hypothetical protein
MHSILLILRKERRGRRLFEIVDGEAEQRDGYFQSSTPFLDPLRHRERNVNCGKKARKRPLNNPVAVRYAVFSAVSCVYSCAPISKTSRHRINIYKHI